ncbi:2,3-dihydro-2,3-dihydroxybenzoate dehydrogenase [Streptomyces sp. Amel2xB2]|uniref:2,3-dihydro-2,3-dihydroxybenzoate dehydrogenase n=1 Tax=Streptomyces sp. Amel2xB2 TaxID=1305829 RepID=UPI000DBA79E7|nr:2,3-dihydro-2,3-dihydroxybenzoate dehydrogenase [Streptomyces sp. Amel2xB2]RAJ58981.1 2,3-dihydro-2,3-dihydroxybenzoate dehydrogenase [Streptomyces sp. Amel2xB2]
MEYERPAGRGEFDGRTALVTGAGNGIGRAVAVALVAHGARVAAVDRDADALKSLEEECGSAAVLPHVADVADSAAVEEVVGRTERESGPVELLVNVAGVLTTAPVTEFDDADWERIFAVNAGGVFRTSRAVARRMVARGGGSIVTVASNAGGVPRTGMAAYAASKAAAAHFTKCLGLEVGRFGVRCNVVSPGSTDTAMQRRLWDGEEPPAAVLQGDPDTYRTGIPLGRIADPRDVADAVLFLLSDRARQITLHDLYVDGGATLRA